MPASAVPTLMLNNGVEMPALGFGVFQIPPADTASAVEAALGVGYRLIDNAAGYMNERGAGEGISRSGIERNEILVETKLWISATATTVRYAGWTRVPASWASTRST